MSYYIAPCHTTSHHFTSCRFVFLPRFPKWCLATALCCCIAELRPYFNLLYDVTHHDMISYHIVSNADAVTVSLYYSLEFHLMAGEGFTGTLREGKEVLVKVQSEDAAWVANRLGNIGITGDTCRPFVVIVVSMIS